MMRGTYLPRASMLAFIVLGMLAAAAPAAWAETVTVQNTEDSGIGSLRHAIAQASPDDTIVFADDVRGEISLTSGELLVDKNLTIGGPGAGELTVRRSSASGTPDFNVFRIQGNPTVTISGLTISGGKASSFGGTGGGIRSDGTLTLRESVVSGNKAASGGGVYADSGVLNVEDSTISGNEATIYGGGIYNEFGSEVTVEDSTISGNEAASEGGGIYSRQELTVEDSTISGNNATDGGGILANNQMMLRNSTVSSNDATNRGGGIASSSADIVASTITANDASSDGGVYSSSSVSIGNSIVAGNVGGDIAEASVFDRGFNLIGGDPGLGPLQDNGGPTETHAPLIASSPAVDQGNGEDFTTHQPLDADQRGLPRPRDFPSIANAQDGDGTDIGAVELDKVDASVSGATISEGDSGTTDATFTVRLSHPGFDTVSVDYATEDDTATSPEDYAATSGTLTFAPGQTSRSINVPVNGDTLDEMTETFWIGISERQGATITDRYAVATIRDDDPEPTVSAGDVTVTGGRSGTTARFAVSLSSASGRFVTVDYATENGTATAESDYQETSGTLFFSAGATTRTVAVPVSANTRDETTENFFVNLSGTSNAAVADDRGEGTIDDGLAPTVLKTRPTGESVAPGADVRATFSEKMSEDTLVTDPIAQTSTTVKLVRRGTSNPVLATVAATENADGATVVTLDPSDRLKRGATYEATITTEAEDLAGNPLARKRVWSFTVR